LDDIECFKAGRLLLEGESEGIVNDCDSMTNHERRALTPDENSEDFGLYFFEEVSLLQYGQIDFIDGETHQKYVCVNIELVLLI
jgi:hypothetical protein